MKISPQNQPSSSWYWMNHSLFYLWRPSLWNVITTTWANFQTSPLLAISFMFFLVMWILLLCTLNVKICIGFVFFPHFKWRISFSDLSKCDNDYLYDVLMPFQARTDMEQQTIEGASTSDAVGFITVVQSLKRKIKNWEKSVEVCDTTLYYMAESVSGQDKANPVFLLAIWAGPSCRLGISHIGSARKNKFSIDQIFLVKITGCSPCYFYAFLLTEMKTQKRAWSITSHLHLTLGK